MRSMTYFTVHYWSLWTSSPTKDGEHLTGISLHQLFPALLLLLSQLWKCHLSLLWNLPLHFREACLSPFSSDILFFPNSLCSIFPSAFSFLPSSAIIFFFSTSCSFFSPSGTIFKSLPWWLLIHSHHLHCYSSFVDMFVTILIPFIHQNIHSSIFSRQILLGGFYVKARVLHTETGQEMWHSPRTQCSRLVSLDCLPMWVYFTFYY